MKKISFIIIAVLLSVLSLRSNAQQCEVTIGEIAGMKAGDIVLIPVYVKGFKNVSSLGFDIDIKNTVLTNVDNDKTCIANVHTSVMAGLISNLNTTADISISSLRIGWYDMGVNGITIADNTKLLDLRFKYLGGTTTLCFDVDNSVVSDQNYLEIKTAWNCGAVNGNTDYCKANFAVNSGSLQYTFKFEDKSIGNITERLWEFGDGQTSAEVSPEHTFLNPGFYNVCLAINSKLNDNVVCADTICQKFFVQDIIPQYNCHSYFASSFKDSASGYQFTDLSNGTDITDWYWDFGDNNTSIEANPTHRYDESGEYTVCLKVTAKNTGEVLCENTYCEETYVMVDNNHGAGGYYCLASFYALENSIPNSFDFFGYGGTGADHNDWLWDFGDGQTSSERFTSHTFNDPGKYKVCLKVAAIDNGSEVCSETYCKTVTVDSIAKPPADYCFNQFSFRITDTTSTSFKAEFNAYVKTNDPLQFDWDFGDDVKATIYNNSISHLYTKKGNINVCLTTSPSSDPSSCSFTTCQTIMGKQDNSFSFGSLSGQVYMGSNPAEGAYVALVKLDNNVQGSITYLDVNQTDANGYYSFSYVPFGYYYVFTFPNPLSADFNKYLPTFYGDTWNWEDANTVLVGNQSSNNINIHFIDVGKKKKDGKGSTCISGNIINGDYSSNKENNAENTEVVLLNESNIPIAFTYTDKKGYYKFEGLEYGIYKVNVHLIGVKTTNASVTLTSSKSCYENVNFQVDSPIAIIPSVVTSVKANKKSDNSCSEVYPNPVNDNASIKISNMNTKNSDLNLAIYNNIGQQVYSRLYKAVNGTQVLTFNTDGLKTGMYFVKVSGNNLNAVRRFIKTN